MSPKQLHGWHGFIPGHGYSKRVFCTLKWPHWGKSEGRNEIRTLRKLCFSIERGVYSFIQLNINVYFERAAALPVLTPP